MRGCKSLNNCVKKRRWVSILHSFSATHHFSLLAFSTPQEYEAKVEQLEATLMKQLQTDTAVEKLEEQRKMFMSKLEELETTLSQRHHEVTHLLSSVCPYKHHVNSISTCIIDFYFIF